MPMQNSCGQIFGWMVFKLPKFAKIVPSPSTRQNFTTYGYICLCSRHEGYGELMAVVSFSSCVAAGSASTETVVKFEPDSDNQMKKVRNVDQVCALSYV